MENPASLTDDELLEAFERTTCAPGDLEAEALLTEIQRRELDV